MKEIRFGVIGCGMMGREFASTAARWMHLLEMPAKPVITVVSDLNPEALEWFKTHHNLSSATTNYQELLQNPEIDAIYCAVPHNMHEQIYVDCIKAGKHLFAEKPFGINLSAATRIIEAMNQHPEVLVRCSSEFPFYPGAQAIAAMVKERAFGQIIEVRASFCHSSDLDPQKPINWKRQSETNGEYGCMGDLGLHVLHLPLRFGFKPMNVRALLSNIFSTRPNSYGGFSSCDTWDNSIMACESEQGFPMIFETKRVSPGDTNTWSISILGTQNSAEFTTKRPKTLRTLPYQSGSKQTWQEEDLGYSSAYPTITGHIFEFGFSDAVLQMWAAFIDELLGNTPRFGCATPQEALASHQLFTAALESHRTGNTIQIA